MEAFQHTGSNALLTHAMNFLGSSIRIMTTIKEVGWDMAMLSGFSMFVNGVVTSSFCTEKTLQPFFESWKKRKA